MKRQERNVTAEMQNGRVSPACLSTHPAMRSSSFAVPGLRRRSDSGLLIWDREAASSNPRPWERISTGVHDHQSGRSAGREILENTIVEPHNVGAGSSGTSLALPKRSPSRLDLNP